MPSRKPINQNLYQGSLEGLTQQGVPQKLAEQVSEIAATDDYEAPNLGRTPEQQYLVASAMAWMKARAERGGKKE